MVVKFAQRLTKLLGGEIHHRESPTYSRSADNMKAVQNRLSAHGLASQWPYTAKVQPTGYLIALVALSSCAFAKDKESG